MKRTTRKHARKWPSWNLGGLIEVIIYQFRQQKCHSFVGYQLENDFIPINVVIFRCIYKREIREPMSILTQDITQR